MKILTIIAISLTILFANSGGPNAGHANNAPSFNNCTSCHSGTVNAGNGSVSFTGLPESYVPGTTYEITVTVDGQGSSGYGFQAIAQVENTAAGTLLLNENSSQAEINGNYIQQSAPTSSSDGASGSWVFDWIAPASDIGDITFSASGLAANYPNSNSGDEVYTISATVGAQIPLEEDLFISEYAEGSASNKYIEIYNSTDSDIDLSSYSVQGTNNGTAWGDNGERDVQLSGVLASNDVYVLAADEADQIILDQADLALSYESPMHHNGDDGIALLKNGSIIDAIGVDNDDPGTAWDVAGVTDATKDHTLVRKANITEGNGGDWTSSAGDNLNNSEWIALEQDVWDYIGSHPHDISIDDDPLLEIVSPENGETIFSNQITVDFLVSNFSIGAIDAGLDGHIHYSLDAADPVMYYSTDPIIISDLTIGNHTFMIWLVDNDHASLNPVISDTISFSISEGMNYTAIYDIQYVSDPDADDASPLVGQEVSINGIVTAEFWGSDDKKYMHVQDANGPWNGIVCYEADGWDQFDWTDESGVLISGPGEGDLVSLTGTVNEYYNLTQLIDISVGVVHAPSDGNLVILPSETLAGDISESYEGCLIELSGAMVSEVANEYGEWNFSTIDINGGGTVVCDDKWAYFYFPTLDQELSSVTGVLDYSFSAYKLQPRLARDVVEQGLTRIQRVQQVLYSDLMKAGEDEVSDKSYMEGDTVTIEGIVTMPTGLSYAGSGVKFIFSDINGGPWSSVLSYDPDSSAFPSLFEGDIIQATGYIGEYTTGPANMTELFITEPINIIDYEQPLPSTSVVSTGDLRWPTEAEQWGNVMIKIEDALVTENDLQYEVFAVDDGSGSVLVDDDSDSIQAFFAVAGPPPIGSLVQSIEGWLYHHYGSNADSTAYKLCPLEAGDIEFGSGPPSITSTHREPCAPMANDDEVIISCTILDNSTIAEALVHYSVDGGDHLTVSMSTNDDSLFSAVVPTSGASFISYYISATDDGADQSEAKTSVHPYDIDAEQLGFHLTDELTIDMVQQTPWERGNTLYEGCVVTLSGVVTADTAQYNSSYSSYALQNGSDQWSGLIFDTEEIVTLSRGQEATITGLITDNDPDWDFKFGGNTRLINAEVSLGSQLSEPAFLNVSCEDVSLLSEEVESYEGVLVKLSNVTISSVNDFDWMITDESGFETLLDDDMANMEADNFLSTLVEGQELAYVSGIFNFSYGSYKIQIRDVNDIGGSLGINDDIQVNPYSYSLMGNYPNPFNPETQIRFSIGNQENVKLFIYDMMGRQVNSLINGETFKSGYHVVNWRGVDNDGNKVPSGVYIYRIKAGDFIADKKMLLLK